MNKNPFYRKHPDLEPHAEIVRMIETSLSKTHPERVEAMSQSEYDSIIAAAVHNVLDPFTTKAKMHAKQAAATLGRLSRLHPTPATQEASRRNGAMPCHPGKQRGRPSKLKPE